MFRVWSQRSELDERLPVAVEKWVNVVLGMSIVVSLTLTSMIIDLEE